MTYIKFSRALIVSVTLIATVVLQGCSNTSTEAVEKNSKAEFLNTKPSNERLPFSEVVRTNDLLFLSGQIGFDAKQGKLVEGGLKAETEQTLKNIKSTLNKFGYSMSDVVKCTVMLTDINDFKAFNEVYTQYFTPPYPSRSAFAVKDLAINSKVEVECIAKV